MLAVFAAIFICAGCTGNSAQDRQKEVLKRDLQDRKAELYSSLHIPDDSIDNDNWRTPGSGSYYVDGVIGYYRTKLENLKRDNVGIFSGKYLNLKRGKNEDLKVYMTRLRDASFLVVSNSLALKIASLEKYKKDVIAQMFECDVELAGLKK